jgi:hypothetical protein
VQLARRVEVQRRIGEIIHAYCQPHNQNKRQQRPAQGPRMFKQRLAGRRRGLESAGGRVCAQKSLNFL